MGQNRLDEAAQQLDSAEALEPDAPDLACLLYTSDAADERSSVDLGGRRFIKKKNMRRPQAQRTISG